MSEYTSTREGWQRLAKWSLSGPPDEAQRYADTVMAPTFYHVANGHRNSRDEYVKYVAEWRAKVSDYEPVIHEFLRDEDQLALHMTGTIKVEGIDTKFESFMFGTVDKQSGKMESLIEHSVWGPVGE